MIGSSENRVSYNGDGVATEFAYQFKILDRSDVKVLLIDNNDIETLLTKDYYVDMEKSVVLYPGYAPGAEIPESERPSVLPTGWKLVLYREVPITQLSQMPTQWPFNVIEDMADKLTIICQQLYDGVMRSFKVSVGVMGKIDTTIPWVAGRSFRVNDEGTGLVTMENPESVLAENKAVLEESKTARDEAQGARDVAVSSANSAAGSASNAASSAQAASNSANDAAQSAHTAAGYVSNVTIWNGSTEYNPPDVVMTSDGSTYRCIKSNIATNPQNHPEYWAMTTSVEAKTFEFDLNGDLMPKLMPITSHMWEVADDGDIMPIGMDDVSGDVYQLADNNDIDEMMKDGD